MFLPPVPDQGLGDLFLGALAALIAQLGQFDRIATAGQDGFDDRHPGLAHDVADDQGELEVHLHQGLLPVLDVSRGIRDQVLALTDEAAQDHDLVLGPERLLQQAVAMQPLNPLAVVDVALGATVDLGYGPSIDQKDLEAAPLEELIEGDPVDAGGLHGDGIDAPGGEPIGERLEIGGEGVEAADGLGIAVGRDGDPMDTVVDVDAGGPGILHREGRLGFGSGGGGEPTRDWGSARGGHRDLRGKGRDERGGQEGEMGMQSPKRDQEWPGLRPGDPVANEAVAASRTTLYYGHEAPGLIRSRPPLCDHDDRRAQANPGFLTDAPPPGRRGTLYWSMVSPHANNE